MKKYIDLGLPSGTLWASDNEEGYYTYNEAVEKFEDNLPTKEQFEELKSKCKWQWIGSGYKVVGPNGKYIYLPAAGYRDCIGIMNNEGSRGYYWSSTLSILSYAWYFELNSKYIMTLHTVRSCKLSIRLVKNK